MTRTGYPEPQRQANAIFDATYAFDNKYIVQASLDYAGANNYAKKNRYKVFPSGGLAWIVSDENFMENVDFIDYLKVRGQAARLGAMYFTQTTDMNRTGTLRQEMIFGYPGGSATDWFGRIHRPQIPQAIIYWEIPT